MKFINIGSSSKGNTSVIETADGSTAILIDAGMSVRSVRTITNINFNSCFITHGHIDHVKHVQAYSTKFGCDIYAHEDTVAYKPSCFEKVPVKFVKESLLYVVGGFKIYSFKNSHDITCLGYVFEDQTDKLRKKSRFGYVTDTGIITDLAKFMLQTCDTIFIEADYDDNKLINNPDYDENLKNRIKSDFGHLSNEDVADFLFRVPKKFDNVIIGHLSDNNNSPELVKEATKSTGHKITVAPITHWITV